MKYSIVMAYHNRQFQLINSIISISKSICKDIEIIIVDDNSREEQRIESIINRFPLLNIKIIRINEDEKKHVNPCIPYNMGFKKASGETVIIQNPECIHIGDILDYIDKNFKQGEYYAFGCYSLSEENTKRIDLSNTGSPDIITYMNKTLVKLPNVTATHDYANGWYNHSRHRPVGYHFVSCIKKQDLDELGGFDERYANGIGWDDNEFLHRVKLKGLSVKIVDTPFAMHQWHESNDASYKKGVVTYNTDLYKNVTLQSKNWRVNN